MVVPWVRTSRSITVACPEVGGRRPSRILISVLLPAPLAPTRPMIPGSSSRVRPSSAVTPRGYRLVRSRRAMRLMAFSGYPGRKPATHSAETDAGYDPVGLGQQRFESGVSRRLDGDHEDAVVAVDDDDPGRPGGLEIERLGARAEEGHPIRAGRSQVDDRRLVLVDLSGLRSPGGDTVRVDERLGDKASGSRRIGRFAVRIDPDEAAREGQATLLAIEADQVRLPHRCRPAVAELEQDRRLEP